MAENAYMRTKWESILALGVLDKHEAWSVERWKEFNEGTSLEHDWYPQVVDEVAVIAEPALGSRSEWHKVKDALSYVTEEHELYTRRSGDADPVDKAAVLVVVQRLVEKLERELAWWSLYIEKAGLMQAARSEIKDAKHYLNKVWFTHQKVTRYEANLAGRVAS